jgi:hypothetical protein
VARPGIKRGSLLGFIRVAVIGADEFRREMVQHRFRDVRSDAKLTEACANRAANIMHGPIRNAARLVECAFGFCKSAEAVSSVTEKNVALIPMALLMPLEWAPSTASKADILLAEDQKRVCTAVIFVPKNYS